MNKNLIEYVKSESIKRQAIQTEIDNNPDSITLYSYEINLDTLVTKSHEQKFLFYDEDMTGYAEYEESLDGRRVYAESLVSKADARTHVWDYCHGFTVCADKIKSEICDESLKLD